MIHHGDCVEVMAAMEPESVDAIVTDPPYGLEFMGKAWDRLAVDRRQPSDPTFHPSGVGQFDRTTVRHGYGKGIGPVMQEWHHRWAVEALRVAKPGAYLLAFGGTRTVHRLACAIEDAGWIIRDTLVWAYACLSDDTEVLTSEGWVRYNRANEGSLAAAFDPDSGELRWEAIEAVHRYDHEGPMAEVGPSLVTLNHRVVLQATPQPQVPLPGPADLHRLWDRLPDMGPLPGDSREDVLVGVPVGAAAGSSSPEAARGAQGSDGDVRDVRQGVLATGGVVPTVDRSVLLATVQRQAPVAEPAVSGGAARRADRGVAGVLPREDERPAQSGLEGRRYRVQEARELLGRAVRSSAGVGATDGSQGRLRHGASPDRGRENGLPADPDGVREPREPRPDRQRPGEPEPLAGQPDAQALRVGQVPGGHGEPDAVRLVADYSGVVWCITVPSGAFVARRNGVVFVTGNSGFPKSKASLKPAWEPIVMARKPGPLR
ncbi:MAG: hypothetical protein H0W36_07765, partial [Gemmatimonadetes bacterium]|nr:hypothetical protein [Gemmatimonadota bacterium]